MSDDLARLLLDTATGLEGAEAAATGGAMELRLDGRAFASIEGGTAVFRLRPEVARAALRTPDTAPSPVGAGWIAFAPAALDQFARDRATAWLESAWRLADDASADEEDADEEDSGDAFADERFPGTASDDGGDGESNAPPM